MNVPRTILRTLWWVGCLVLVVGSAHRAAAQEQDHTLLTRIMRPDLTMHAEGFSNSYEPASSGENKTFLTRLFGGSRAATPKAGGGSFHTSAFASGRDHFAVNNYSTHSAAAASREPFGTRGFATKTMPVNEDRAAGKSAPVESYAESHHQFEPHGKRQDTIDELRREKNLTVDQVRDILNKNK